MKKMVLVVTGLNLVALAPSAIAEYQYPPEMVSSYLAECREISLAEGLAEEEATMLCDCTLDQFQQQYSLEEYKQLPIELKEEVGYFCFEELLYEE